MDTFKQQRHKDYSVSFEYLNDLLQRKVGKVLLSFKKVIAGCDKEVYKVTTVDSVLYVMFNHYGTAFKNEVWAIKQVRNLGIPAPEVLFFDEVEKEGSLADCMIQKALVGRPVSIIWENLDKVQKVTVLQNLALMLKKMHGISTEGFYKMDKDGNWDFNSFVDLIDSAIRDRKKEFEYTSQAGLTKEELDECLGLMVEYKSLSKNARAILCHGDLSLRHIYVDEELNISGVLDFGDFQGGVPVSDFVDICNELDDEEWNLFVQTYYNGEVPSSFEKQMSLHKVSYLLGKLAWYVKESREEKKNKALRKLRVALANLDSLHVTSSTRN